MYLMVLQSKYKIIFFREMGLFTLHNCWVPWLMNFLMLKIDSQSRLPIPEFSGYHCNYKILPLYISDSRLYRDWDLYPQLCYLCRLYCYWWNGRYRFYKNIYLKLIYFINIYFFYIFRDHTGGLDLTIRLWVCQQF